MSVWEHEGVIRQQKEAITVVGSRKSLFKK